jgi:hypothetical protein
MIASVLVAVGVVAAAPQLPTDTSAGIYGAAISSYNGLPIAGVLVAVPAAGKVTVTDAAGRFALSGLPSGKRVIQISYDGRVTEDYFFTLEPLQSKRIAVLLDPDSIDLDPLVVEALEPNVWLDLAGFYERRAAYRGFAHFFTREEIGRVHPAKLSGLLTIEGIVTRCYADCRPTRFSRGRLCFVPVSVDGVSLREADYDQIDVATVAAVEVYRGVPPPDLSRSLLPVVGASTWMGTGRSAGGSCGLVEIWTR